MLIKQIINGVEEGYSASNKQNVVNYSVFAAVLYNEGLLNSEELLRFLLYLINYNIRERKFKFTGTDNINDNFRVVVVTECLDSINDKLFKDLKHKMFLVLFQLYVLSRSYISSHQEFKVVDCMKRLYPQFNFLKRTEHEKIAYTARLMEERNPDILKKNLQSLEQNPVSPYTLKSVTHKEEENNSSKISRKVEEIQEKWRIENSEKMKNNFDYEFNLMMNQEYIDGNIKNGLYTLSSNNVADLRKKNETKNNLGVKLIVRNKNRYESKSLIADPRSKNHDESSEGEEEEYDEGEEGEDFDNAEPEEDDEDISENETSTDYNRRNS